MVLDVRGWAGNERVVFENGRKRDSSTVKQDEGPGQGRTRGDPSLHHIRIICLLSYWINLSEGMMITYLVYSGIKVSDAPYYNQDPDRDTGQACRSWEEIGELRYYPQPVDRFLPRKKEERVIETDSFFSKIPIDDI